MLYCIEFWECLKNTWALARALVLFSELPSDNESVISDGSTSDEDYAQPLDLSSWWRYLRNGKRKKNSMIWLRQV